MKRLLGWPIALCVCAIVIGVGRLRGDEVATSAEPSVEELVDQLGATEFAERQEASRKLTEAGKTVFDRVEKAAESGSREVATRAVDILRRHFTGGDLETKDAAKAALERLAKGGNPAAAQRAGEALNPQPPATIPQAIGGINPVVLQQLQQRGIQIQLGGIAPAQNIARRTSIRTVNGLREIEVQTNGKITTRKIEAKDLDDLKKKDADVAQIYETYSRAGRGIPIGIAIPPGGLPPGALPPGVLPGGAVPAAQADALKRTIESIDRSIERYKARLPNDPTAQQRIDSLERTKKRYQDMLPKEEARPAEGNRPAEGAGPGEVRVAENPSADLARKVAEAAAEAARRAAEAAADQAAEASRKP
jgi:ribosomal protein S19E (S16A)